MKLKLGDPIINEATKYRLKQQIESETSFNTVKTRSETNKMMLLLTLC